MRPRPRIETVRASISADDGIIVVDKPAGFTSHDVVGAMRRLAATRKVGHAGTLDPMATGVLVLGIGKATRLLRYISGADKSYRATVCLGIATDSDDADGTITERPGCNTIDVADIDREIRQLTGSIEQVPATVSAIKVNGQRAHALHRAGKNIQLEARPVTITRFERVSEVRWREYSDSTTNVPIAEFEVEVDCSAGTYVRCLARDLGVQLGTGGHLRALRRTRVGHWRIEQAQTIEQLNALVENGDGEPAGGALPVISLTDACTRIFDSLELEEGEARALRYGNATRIQPRTAANIPIAALYEGRVTALIELRENGYKPLVVFDTNNG
ncbi:MAG: tRNA pseudouridine(55) synthase TruB [Actinomycetaceae bacterium]|nr:tRNA pseudouridine(55) synthase TruB [Actinomycetaceae bacterium]